jgi:RNA polymerase sigma-70 factor, ECF subfamily
MDERRARFEALVAEVHDPLDRYLRRRASSHDADDVMGDVLLTLWRRLDAIPQPTPLPWCYGVARRALANHRRSDLRRLRLVSKMERQPQPPPSDEIDHPELAAALANLSSADREIIALWAWEDLEPREIAVVLETTPNAVSIRLSRLRKKLADEILRQNPTGAGHIQDGTTGAHE